MITEKILTLADQADWRRYLPASQSVFGSIEYARIYQKHSGYGANLYVLDAAGDGTIAKPFFLRPIADLPFARDVRQSLFDIVTPEYTGPMFEGEVIDDLAVDFVRHFEVYCQRQSIVAEFGHLHPWNCCFDCLHAESVVPEREIVYVDLTVTEEQLWNDSFSYACRKNIRRAQKEEVRVFPATQAGDVREFHRIYLQTMQRNQALDKYYFPLDYFMAFFEQMPERARFALAEQRGQVIAATLYLHDDQDVYSYLGGADQNFQQIRPTNAVVFDTIQWAKQNGKRRLILGGGYTPEDGIFRFKSSFSPLRAQFKVYRRIHLSDRFDELCTAWAKYYDCTIPAAGYFPIYRALPKSVTEMTES